MDLDLDEMSENERLISLYPELDPEPDAIYPYTRDIDNSSVRCICNIPLDDGATIQCDNCYVWQHMICVLSDQKNIPNSYYCEECQPRELDVQVPFYSLTPQNAIINQTKVQRQKRVERADVIQEILAKRMDKSPKKKPHHRKKLAISTPSSPKKPKVKPQIKTMQSPVFENISPIVKRQRVSSNSIGPKNSDTIFSITVPLDDWTRSHMCLTLKKKFKSDYPVDAYEAEYAATALDYTRFPNIIFDNSTIIEQVKSWVLDHSDAPLYDFNTPEFLEHEHQLPSIENLQNNSSVSPIMSVYMKTLLSVDMCFSIELSSSPRYTIPYFGLYTIKDIPADTFITTLNGNLTLQDDLPSNYIPISKLQEDSYVYPPFTKKLSPDLPWIMDSRLFGSEDGRFIKTTCPSFPNANAYIRLFIIKDAPSDLEKLAVGIFSKESISQGQEIILETNGYSCFPCPCNNSTCPLFESFSLLGDSFKESQEALKVIEEEQQANLIQNHNTLYACYERFIKMKKPIPDFILSVINEHKMNKKNNGMFKELESKVSIGSPRPFGINSKEYSTKNSKDEIKVSESVSKDKGKYKTPTKVESMIFPKDSNFDYLNPMQVTNETTTNTVQNTPQNGIDVKRKQDEEDGESIFKKPRIEMEAPVEIASPTTPSPMVKRVSLKDFLQKRGISQSPQLSSSSISTTDISAIEATEATETLGDNTAVDISETEQ